MKGSMAERSPGVWQLRVPGGLDPKTGKYKQFTRTVKGTKREAQRALATFVSEVDQQKVPMAPKRLTVDAYLSKWLAAHATEVSARTMQGYRDIVERYVRPRLGVLALVKLTALDLQSLYAELMREGGRGGRPLSPQTCKHVHRCLFTALDRAEKMQLIPKNPAALVNAPRVEGKEVAVIETGAGAQALIAAAQGHRLFVGVLLALAAGLRRGELLALRWQDIDFDRSVLRVTRAVEEVKEEVPEGGRRAVLRIKPPKTRKGRRAVTLPPSVMDSLRQHRREQIEQLVMTGARPDEDFVMVDVHTGAMVTPNAFSQAFHEIARKAGINVTLHGLRHSHITALLAAGVPVKAVSERAGHSSISVTADIYGHVLASMGDAAAAATETWLTPTGKAIDQNHDQKPERKVETVADNVTAIRRQSR